ncbi:unnamed protein product [Rhodiola kirilowii]
MERHRRLLSLLNTTLSLNHLKQIHAVLVTNYSKLAPILIKRLILQSFTVYARKVFDQIPQREQKFCYSYMIYAYSKRNMSQETLETFALAHSRETENMCFSVPPVLKCCVLESDVVLGKQVHSLAIRCGFDFNNYVQCSLIDFYAKSGDVDSGQRVFDGLKVKDPVCYNCLISGYSKTGQVLAARKLFDEMGERTIASWNAMLSCYLHNGEFEEGLNVFQKMLVEGFEFDEMTLVTVLSTCAKVGNLKMGLKVKQLIDDNNLRLNVVVSTAILEMFVKCGAVNDARKEFDSMCNRDVVAWSAMIAGYAQNGRPNEALDLFEKMKIAGMEPNDVTVVSILSACAQLGSVEFGERIGSFVENRGFASNVQVTSALLDMYSRCGNIKKARQLFDNMNTKDVVTWNSMIRGLAFNGSAEDVMGLYEKMKAADVKPDDVTFVGLLTAFTHAGLVDLGVQFFRMMKLDYNLTPKIEHCACIVDLYCKSGKLDEAYDFVCNMGIQPNVTIWGTLLSASRIHSNLDLAEISAKKLLELEPENSGNYILLANIYIAMGKWKEASSIRSMMRNKSLQKTAAYSWVELENEVHKFLVGDKNHPLSNELCSSIDSLTLLSAPSVHDLGTDMDV